MNDNNLLSRGTGHHNGAITQDDLPPAHCSRWVTQRKADVVNAVASGLLTITEACQRYDLTLEEFASWKRAVQLEGMPGLRATCAQDHRNQEMALNRGVASLVPRGVSP